MGEGSHTRPLPRSANVRRFPRPERRQPPPPPPTYLTPETYRTRFESHQSGAARSALVILALVAFWFAIESGYAQYLEGLRDKSEARQAVDGSKKAGGSLDVIREQCRIRAGAPAAGRTAPASASPAAQGAAKAATPTGSATADAPAIERCVNETSEARQREEAKDLKTNQDKVADRARELRKTAVTLSIAGTNLPPRLILAAPVWLAALLAWLIYLDARRAAAYLNLARYRDSLPAAEQLPEAAGEGTVWLAPLRVLPPRAGDGDVGLDPAALYKATADLVGWDATIERRYVAVLWLILGAMAIAAVRLAVIGFDLTAASAVKMLEESRLADMQPSRSGSSVLLMAISVGLRAAIVALVVLDGVFIAKIVGVRTVVRRVRDRLAGFAAGLEKRIDPVFRGNGTVSRFNNPEPAAVYLPEPAPRAPVVGRRLFVLGGAAGLASVAAPVLWWSTRRRVGPPAPAATTVPAPVPSATRRVPRNPNPRFVSAERKRARFARYRIFHRPEERTGPAPDLYGYAVEGRRGTDGWKARKSQVLAAAFNGEVRLFAPASALRVRIYEGQALKYLGTGERADPAWSGPGYDPNRTNAFELAALRALEAGKVDHACDLLLAGIALSLTGARRPALRLMDLLAGLCVRHGRVDHLAGLKRLLGDPRHAVLRTRWVSVKPGVKEPDPIAARLARWSDKKGTWWNKWAQIPGGTGARRPKISWTYMTGHMPAAIRGAVIYPKDKPEAMLWVKVTFT